MSKQTGSIGVKSENIFPIIKKFLYSDHEIFLREIVSNAVDATQKLRTLSATGDFKGEIGEELIEVKIDKKAGTLTVSDRGIGMTQEEVEKYINQIALSGAEEFLEKYKDKGNSIIGHFGLGFYSAFMVSSRVEIDTLSWQPDATPIHWSCEGDPAYTLSPSKRTTRGTDIILHISEENAEFLEESRIQELLLKYCRFLPVPIACGRKSEWKEGKKVETDEPNIINDLEPLWTRRPSELKPEDYDSFYSGLFPTSEPPLFNIHLNVDYPFNLTGILYFPRLRSNFDIQRNKIQLYSNQVFVTDAVEGIVPEFLTVLHGVIDSPDIPLNVSRSYLQSDHNVRKISSHITRKVADRLLEIFEQDRQEFESKWDDLKLFVDYGSVSEERFYEKSQKFALLKNVDDKYFTYEEYQKLVEGEQTDKHGKAIYLYSSDPEQQWSYIEQAKARGYDVLVMQGQLDPHLINFLEQKLENVRFARVDSDTIDRLIEKSERAEVSLSEDAQTELRGVMDGAAEKSSYRLFVSFEELGERELPAIITQNEFMRRMKDMAALSPTNNFYASMPENLNLVLNSSHPLVKRLSTSVSEELAGQLSAADERIDPLEKELSTLNERLNALKDDEVEQSDKDKREELESKLAEARSERRSVLEEFGRNNNLAQQLIDLALLSNNLLKGEALAQFVQRSVSMIE